MNMAGKALNFRDHGLIAQQICHFEFSVPGLTCAQELARATDLQVFLRNDESVVAVTQYLQTHLRGF